VFVVNVYLRGDPTASPWTRFRDTINAIHPAPGGPVLIAGDFNPPAQAPADWAAAFGASLGLAPMLRPGVPTRERPGVNETRRQLDQIFSNLPGQPPTPGRLADPPALMLESDHTALEATVVLPRGLTGEPLGAEPPRIRWERLEILELADTLRPDLLALPGGLDAATLNDRLLDIARLRLGVRPPHRRLRDPAWSRPGSGLQEAHRALSAAPSQAARHRFKRLLLQERLRAHLAKLEKMRRGDLMTFHSLHRHRNRPGHTSCALDPSAAAGHFRGVWSRDPAAPPPRSSPYVERIAMVVTTQEVAEAIAAAPNSAAGPDGLSIRLFKVFRDDLLDLLSGVFTAAVQDLHPRMKLGRCLLFPKGLASSTNPNDYRPITILPAMTRIFLSIVDQKLRKEARSNPDIKLTTVQAGFMPRPSTHEQVLLFLTVQAEAKARRGPLYGVLLDIAKAFDSLDHGQLLAIMERIGYGPPYLELVRRILTGCQAEIEGEVINLLRGAPQGSPASPFLAVLFFEDLAREVASYVQTHAAEAPALLRHVAGPDIEVLHSVLLLFADDTSALGCSVPFLQGLLDVLTTWASQRFIRFNAAKSLALVLSRPRMAPLVPESAFSIQGAPIDFASEGKLLGIPVRADEPYVRLCGPPDPNEQAIHACMMAIRRVFAFNTTGSARYPLHLVDLPTLRQAIMQYALPRVLYPAPVLPVRTSRVDSILRMHLRIILGLSVNYPKGLLHWQLRLWPTDLTVTLRALQHAWRVLHQHGVGALVKPRVTRGQMGGLLSRGPLGRLTTILSNLGLSWQVLSQHEYRGGLPGYESWTKFCVDLLNRQFHEWARAEILRLPPPLAELAPPAQYSPELMEQPGFVTECGDHSRAALRLQAPSLRRYPSKYRPNCHFCGSGEGEWGAHLVRCEDLPPRLESLRHHMHNLIREEVRAEQGYRTHADTLTAQLPIFLLRMEWPGQQPSTLWKALEFAGRLIDGYSTAVRNCHPPDPPWPIPTVRLMPRCDWPSNQPPA